MQVLQQSAPSRVTSGDTSHQSMARATPISSSTFRHLKYLSNSSPPFHVTFLRSKSTCATTMSAGNVPHPSLELIGGAKDKFLSAFKSLNNPYSPYPVVAWNRHIETIFAAFFRSVPDVCFRRECLRTKDDGSVALDWVSGDDRNLPPDSPLLILLPGLTGGSDDSYVRHMLMRARSRGWRVVVFNSRGCGDSPVTTPQSEMFVVDSEKNSCQDERAGAEIVCGAEECLGHSVELLKELGFPMGVLALKDLEECGRVRETEFVWMKQKAPYEHYFVATKTLVSYGTEVTAYVEKGRMKKMTGVKSKQLFMWVPIVEMSIEDPAQNKINFKTPIGIGKSFPLTAFMTDEEKQKYLEKANE
ncbi:hypothetical protein RND71_016909 [Anisodus tanguticus]|uniref:AB hydrolase-1 domain-containing protein n=1 Tax=Anisodus tanguticus TaxID=243964 RepID=A0AAE1S990_9SOLA|nr:hypothetical protein RND71_016909 [Anisodus tanguticus]